MNNRVGFRQADLTRALKATTKAGLTVQRIEINPDGKIVIVSEKADASDGKTDHLAAWMAERDGRDRKMATKLKGWNDVVGR